MTGDRTEWRLVADLAQVGRIAIGCDPHRATENPSRQGAGIGSIALPRKRTREHRSGDANGYNVNVHRETDADDCTPFQRDLRFVIVRAENPW